jgi:hypothetical protein
MKPSRIEPASFRLVAQCLNQLRHRVKLHVLSFHLKTEEKYLLWFGRKISQEKRSVTDIGVYFQYLNTIHMVQFLGVGNILAKIGPKRRVNISVRLIRPAEAVGFLRAKKSSARLPSEGK